MTDKDKKTPLEELQELAEKLTQQARVGATLSYSQFSYFQFNSFRGAVIKVRTSAEKPRIPRKASHTLYFARNP